MLSSTTWRTQHLYYEVNSTNNVDGSYALLYEGSKTNTNFQGEKAWNICIKQSSYKPTWTPLTTTGLTLILLTWKIWWAPNNASKWQMEFNSAFKGLNSSDSLHCTGLTNVRIVAIFQTANPLHSTFLSSTIWHLVFIHQQLIFYFVSDITSTLWHNI